VKTKVDYLCLADGVALNRVANGRILREDPFKDIWIQPAAGDAGGALGCALAVWHLYHNQPRRLANSVVSHGRVPILAHNSLMTYVAIWMRQGPSTSKLMKIN
jgi:carbamoyltransferase